jgi:hypothetical protein
VKVRCLVSFAARDQRRFERLSGHLRALERAGAVELWAPAEVPAGHDWAIEIERRLAGADIVLLLVSASFLASDRTYELMSRALGRASTGAARVVPVIVTACAWRSSPIGRLRVLPSDGRPLAAWADPEAALSDVASGVARVVAEVRAT